MRKVITIGLSIISVLGFGATLNQPREGISVYSPGIIKKYDLKNALSANLPAGFDVMSAMYDINLPKGSRCLLGFLANNHQMIQENNSDPIVMSIHYDQAGHPEELIPLKLYEYSDQLYRGYTYFSVKIDCENFHHPYKNIQLFFKPDGRLTKLLIPKVLFSWILRRSRSG